MKKEKKAFNDNLISFNFFRRPVIGGAEKEAMPFSHYLTFKNIVLGLGVATFLIFLGSAVSARIAFLFAALLGLAGLVLTEMASRRAWEKQLMSQLQRMSVDYDRLVRELARNRNDMAALKKGLADAGSFARNTTGKPGEAVEQRMIRAMVEQLSKLGAPPEEKEETREPLAEIPENVAISSLTDEQVLNLVNAAVRQDRIDLFLQPIVNLPQRKGRFYEMLSRIRIREDVYLPAERYIAVAMRQDLVPVIDNLLLLRGLQFIRDTEDKNVNRAFFCNITSLTLNDPKFMGDLVQFIAQNRTLAPRLVFELGQRDLAGMSPEALSVLQGLAQLGCRFSMDQVRSLSFDIPHLEARHIRFIKVDAALVLEEMKEEGGLQRMKRLKAELDREGIDLIVERIESERQVRELLDLEIDYGQGFLFGKPAPAEDSL